MSSLFAAAFARPLDEPGLGPTLRYDTERALSVLPDGRPYVGVALTGETETFTKADGEQDDRDDDEKVITLVNNEVDACSGPTDSLGTRAKGETDRWASAPELKTVTEVKAESDDFDLVPYALGTETAVRGESDQPA